MANGTISQSELDALLPLDELESEEEHVWVVVSKDGWKHFGGRCFSYLSAQALQSQAMKDYPGIEMVIKQVK